MAVKRLGQPDRQADGARPGGLDGVIAAVADILDAGGDVDVVTAHIAGILTKALRGADLLTLYADKAKSFTAFVDRQRHFVVHCSVHLPGHHTAAHDHGEAWAVYGVVRGRSRYRRFRRTEDVARGRAALVLERDEELVPGQTDIVRPGHVHLIANETAEPAWNVVVRPRPIGEVWRRRYNVDSGAYEIHPHSLQD